MSTKILNDLPSRSPVRCRFISFATDHLLYFFFVLWVERITVAPPTMRCLTCTWVCLTHGSLYASVCRCVCPTAFVHARMCHHELCRQKASGIASRGALVKYVGHVADTLVEMSPRSYLDGMSEMQLSVSPSRLGGPACGSANLPPRIHHGSLASDARVDPEDLHILRSLCQHGPSQSSAVPSSPCCGLPVLSAWFRYPYPDLRKRPQASQRRNIEH
jgi:hypothetical protein